MNTNIKDLTLYNNSMRTTINDKLFFLDKIDSDCRIFVDFGCADGSLFNEMIKYLDFNKNYLLIGYDNNESMISLAKQNTIGSLKNIKIIFTSDWNIVKQNLTDTCALILSSVIHEIYSYALQNKDICDFYKKCRSFNYVCIRDMMKDHSYDNFRTPNEDFQKVISKYINNSDTNYIMDFCKLYGGLRNYENFVHFLLKYRYKINWEREVNENYFPVYLEELLSKFRNQFQIMYLKRFKIKFLEDRIKEDFDVDLKRPTHVKLILKQYCEHSSAG